MESFFCTDDCGDCAAIDGERAICMQARICSDLGMDIEKWIEECSCNFRSLWDAGMRDKAELADTIRSTNARVVRIVPVPYAEGFAARA